MFHFYVHNVVMDITNRCFVVINYRIIRWYVCNCFMVWGMHFWYLYALFAMTDWYIHNICFFYFWWLWLLFNIVMDITKWCSGVIGVWKNYNHLWRKQGKWYFSLLCSQRCYGYNDSMIWCYQLQDNLWMCM